MLSNGPSRPLSVQSHTKTTIAGSERGAASAKKK